MDDNYKPFEHLTGQDQLILNAFNSSLNGIIIIDHQEPNDPIIYCNPAFEELTGYQKEDILGQNCRFLQGDHRLQEGRFKIRDALKNNVSCITELLNYRKNGTEFYNELYISPIRNSEGAATHFIGIQNNITDRKLKELKAETDLITLQHLQHQKDEFISIASHELKTPLTVLKACLQLLGRLHDEANITISGRLIKQANRSISKISNLVDDLLNSNSVNES